MKTKFKPVVHRQKLTVSHPDPGTGVGYIHLLYGVVFIGINSLNVNTTFDNESYQYL